MEETVRFETPETVVVSYRLAGPGTRFIAFFFDMLIIAIAYLILALAFGLGMILLGPEFRQEVAPYIIAMIFIVSGGFALILYFALFEWLMHGQTPGKRASNIRVVMDGGFSLSFGGVAIRNIFRLIDTIPLLWIVPVVTPKTQRLGDLVAGTIVVAEEPGRVNPLREVLAARPIEQSRFLFSGDQLARLRPVDVQAVELFLERRPALHPQHRLTLLRKLVRGLTTRLQVVEPVTDDEGERFLEDLLGAYGRREAREVG